MAEEGHFYGYDIPALKGIEIKYREPLPVGEGEGEGEGLGIGWI